MDVTQLEKVRPCGRLEIYSTSRHHLGFYNNVGLTATYTTPSAPDASLQDLVFSALHHAIDQHPNLSMVTVSEDKSYPDVYFARLSEIDFGKCVEFRTRSHAIPQNGEPDTELDELLSQQHSLGFKPKVSGPYWRLIVTAFPGKAQVFSASWIFHHALADGTSASLFHESFLEGLNNFSGAPFKNVKSLVNASPAAPAPSLEEMHPMPISWPFFLPAITGSLLPSFLKARPRGLWTGPVIPAQPVPPKVSIVALSAETTKAFVALCRQQQTSATAALSTLLSSALFDILESTSYDQVSVAVPISLRPFLSVGKKTMINAVTNHVSTFQRAETRDSIWDAARRVKTELANEVSKKGNDNPAALLKYVSNVHSYFTSKCGTQRETTSEVSNIGVRFLSASPDAASPNERPAAWAIGRVVFSQSASHTGPAISLSSVTGGDGCLVLSFSFPRDAAPGVEARLREVPALMKRRIEDLVASGESR